MSEPGGATDNTTKGAQGSEEKRVHHCEKCQAVIGVETERNGRPYILIGDHPWLFVEGLCGNCGAEIIWESNARRLDRLIKRQLKARKKVD